MPQLHLFPDQVHVNFLRTNIDQISGNPWTLFQFNQDDGVWGFTFPPLGRNKGLRKGSNLALPAQLNDFEIRAPTFLACHLRGTRIFGTLTAPQSQQPVFRKGIAVFLKIEFVFHRMISFSQS
jgi:hypothetical protein